MYNEGKIIQLIQQYQYCVDQGIYLLKKYFHYDPTHREWWHKGLEQEGVFGPKKQYHYLFHGNWCKLTTEDWSIDVDYEYFNDQASFDASKLVNFAAQIKGYEKFTDPLIVKLLLSSLQKQRLIQRRFPDQYCLPVDAIINRSIIK